MNALTKPAYGSPCNGCGLCCKNELCPLGAFVFNDWKGPCPALHENDGQFSCGLVNKPETYAPVLTAISGKDAMSKAALHLIGSGAGCDARLDGESNNPAFSIRLARLGRKRSAANAAKRLWGVPV